MGDISRPQQDTRFDTIESKDWTKDKHGQPLRGKIILNSLLILIYFF